MAPLGDPVNLRRPHNITDYGDAQLKKDVQSEYRGERIL